MWEITAKPAKSYKIAITKIKNQILIEISNSQLLQPGAWWSLGTPEEHAQRGMRLEVFP